MVSSGDVGLSLAVVQTQQPRQPEDLDEASPSPWNLNGVGKSRQRADPKDDKFEVSTEFQELVDKLLTQYSKEMSVVVREVKDLRAELDEMEGEVLHLKSQNEVLRSEANSPRGADEMSRQGSHTLQDAIKNKHQQMKEMTADDILNILEQEDKQEEDEIEALFKESDFKKLIQRSHTNYVPSESPEERAQRLAKMSRLDRVRDFLLSNTYESLMASVLCVNVLWMAFELQFKGTLSGYKIGMYPSTLSSEDLPAWETAIIAGDLSFTAIFTADLLLRVCLLGVAFWRSWMNYVDLGVIATSLVEITVFYATTMPVNPVLFRLLRIGKLARAFRMVHMTSVLASLQLLVKCLASSANMLFWSFLLLTFVQCVAGVVISTLCFDFITDASVDLTLREEVFKFYGTFTRTFLTMFEVMFANWGPPCRVLVEGVSEWFSLFFLFYRCVLGFAVLNIINAVFVQQTMKTASSDEEIAFKQKQKEKDIQSYTRKVKKLFQTMDASGDGAINLTEFAKLVQSPKLKFWMGQLELEYHDLLSLFEFLDNGDGEITLMEFIDGAARLRGGAKALDIWRIETKVEVLFEEVLKLLQPEADSTGLQSVQNVFNKSSYRHIKCTQMVRQFS